MKKRIRIVLSQHLAPTIIAPCCPDYAHEDGRYTCTSVYGGVPLLARKHIAFLDQVSALLPGANIIILIADQEAEDPKIGAACNKTPQEFRKLIASSLTAVDAAVKDRGWTVRPMTSYVPDFTKQRKIVAERLASDVTKQARLIAETTQRKRLYDLLDPNATEIQKLARTVDTAAQYMVVGTYAKARGLLICNHTTTNLAWYKDSGAAVLHNEVGIY
jgi:glycerol-3-phosphate cytidylyltransferase-like family protein